MQRYAAGMQCRGGSEAWGGMHAYAPLYEGIAYLHTRIRSPRPIQTPMVDAEENDDR